LLTVRAGWAPASYKLAVLILVLIVSTFPTIRLTVSILLTTKLTVSTFLATSCAKLFTLLLIVSTLLLLRLATFNAYANCL
jgi:hypothetical protein